MGTTATTRTENQKYTLMCTTSEQRKNARKTVHMCNSRREVVGFCFACNCKFLLAKLHKDACKQSEMFTICINKYIVAALSKNFNEETIALRSLNPRLPCYQLYYILEEAIWRGAEIIITKRKSDDYTFLLFRQSTQQKKFLKQNSLVQI